VKSGLEPGSNAGSTPPGPACPRAIARKKNPKHNNRRANVDTSEAAIGLIITAKNV
jgi:hypothetical protein